MMVDVNEYQPLLLDKRLHYRPQKNATIHFLPLNLFMNLTNLVPVHQPTDLGPTRLPNGLRPLSNIKYPPSFLAKINEHSPKTVPSLW